MILPLSVAPNYHHFAPIIRVLFQELLTSINNGTNSYRIICLLHYGRASAWNVALQGWNDRVVGQKKAGREETGYKLVSKHIAFSERLIAKRNLASKKAAHLIWIK
ncbi:MAG: hypothetical protein ACC663_10405 [Gammaproteobacteria bacterium]